MLRGMGSWNWGWGASLPVGAVAVSLIVAPDGRAVGIALLLAAITLFLLSFLHIRALLAQCSGRLLGYVWRERMAISNRRHGYIGTVFLGSRGSPAPGTKAALVAVESVTHTTSGTGENWVQYDTWPRALHFTSPVNRLVEFGQWPYELLSWRGRFTIRRIMPTGLLIDDHGIPAVQVSFEVEPLKPPRRATLQPPQPTKHDPSHPPPSLESGDKD